MARNKNLTNWDNLETPICSLEGHRLQVNNQKRAHIYTGSQRECRIYCHSFRSSLFRLTARARGHALEVCAFVWEILEAIYCSFLQSLYNSKLMCTSKVPSVSSITLRELQGFIWWGEQQLASWCYAGLDGKTSYNFDSPPFPWEPYLFEKWDRKSGPNSPSRECGLAGG